MFLIITKATKDDLREILKLQKLVLAQESEKSSHSPLKQTLAQINKDFHKYTFLKATEDDKIIGSVRAYFGNGTANIEKLIVHPDKKGLGIERELLRQIEKCYNVLRYNVEAPNNDKEELSIYQQAGYQIYSTKNLSEDTMVVYLEKFELAL